MFYTNSVIIFVKDIAYAILHITPMSNILHKCYFNFMWILSRFFSLLLDFSFMPSRKISGKKQYMWFALENISQGFFC